MSAEVLVETESPEWKKHWIRYARFNDKQLILVDHELRDPEQKRTHPTFGRYGVGVGPAKCIISDCPDSSAVHFKKIWLGDSLDDAIRTFELSENEMLKE